MGELLTTPAGHAACAECWLRPRGRFLPLPVLEVARHGLVLGAYAGSLAGLVRYFVSSEPVWLLVSLGLVVMGLAALAVDVLRIGVLGSGRANGFGRASWNRRAGGRIS